MRRSRARLERLALRHGAPKRRCEDPEYRAKMETVCIPKEVDARARKRQAELLELNGGRDVVVARGDLGYSPPPGVAVDFN